MVLGLNGGLRTVIAGDSWGHIAVPVIEAYPATAVIFVGSLLTLVFGAARHRGLAGLFIGFSWIRDDFPRFLMLFTRSYTTHP